MPATTFQSKKSAPPQKKKGVSLRERLKPPRSALLALVPVVLSAYYLIMVTPSLVPVPPDVKVPYPAATRFLEKICMWCSEYPLDTCLIGAGILVAAWIGRLFTERSFIYLAILISLGLGFTYLSISAPIDRLINNVEKSLPKDSRVPNSENR